MDHPSASKPSSPPNAGSTSLGTTPKPQKCPDCQADHGTRRQFLATASASLILSPSVGLAAGRFPVRPADSETLVHQLFSSLTEPQRKVVCHPFDHPLRQKVDANWQITTARVTSFQPDQQDLIRQIFRQLHSDEYAQAVWDQVEHDGAGNDGFGGCAIALFGEPGAGDFEFVLSGRHVTRRCDGNSSAGTAFGGPIFYGHAAESFDEAPDHPGNAYWYQAQRANELYQALDGRQRKLALLGDSRGERGNDTVKLSPGRRDFQGIPLSEFSPDQRALARNVLNDVLAPFRECDRKESLQLIEAAGFEKLHFSYFQNENIGQDELWDVWQIEGPNCIWYFRGKPHVHAWVHIRDVSSSAP